VLDLLFTLPNNAFIPIYALQATAPTAAPTPVYQPSEQKLDATSTLS
jgi:hypothetical protein